jgi:dinuclear metal center YbgI/SA1388 family protein
MPRAPIPVASVLRKFYDEFTAKVASLDLAEKWDNVGLLIESPRASCYTSLRILACIDLTPDVVTEAIAKKCNLILSYHPIMFRPIQSLSLSLNSAPLRCIDAGISLFSPHTALDNAEDGMNDFLCNMFKSYESCRESVRTDPVSGISSGRIVRFETAISLRDAISVLKEKLFLSTLRYSSPDGGVDGMIDSIAVCVGSGSSVLSGANASVYLTGEMSHHEILACIGAGKSVILLDHSSSERPFLPELARRLQKFDCVESAIVSASDKEPIRTF